MKNYRKLYWGILAAAGLFYLVMAFSDMIWTDEAYTFAMLRHSFPEIWRITAGDVHPPLYYFLVKLVTMPFGYSEFSVRLFSGLCCWILLAVGGDQLGKLFDEKTGLLFMALTALFPFASATGNEARMYALCELAVFLNGLFAYKIWKNNQTKDWIGFILAGLAAAYSHYFALVSVGVIYGLLLLAAIFGNRKLLKPWLIFSAITIVAYLPWLKCFIEQLAYKVSNEYWIEPITLDTLVFYATSLLHANGHSAFPLYFGLLLAGLVIFRIREKDAWSLLSLAVPAVTFALGVGVSMAIRPIFTIRYLVPCAPLMMFFLARSVCQIRRETLSGAIAAVLLVSFSGNAFFMLTDILPQSGKYDAAFAQETAQAEAIAIVSANSLHASQIVSHYQPETPIYSLEMIEPAANPFPNVQLMEHFSTDNLSAFLIVTDPGTQPDAVLTEGFTVTFVGNYHDIYEYTDVWMAVKSIVS